MKSCGKATVKNIWPLICLQLFIYVSSYCALLRAKLIKNVQAIATMSTPLELFKQNLQKWVIEGDAGKVPVVLLATGAYNPVHRMHIDVFRRAKQSLESMIIVNLHDTKLIHN